MITDDESTKLTVYSDFYECAHGKGRQDGRNILG